MAIREVRKDPTARGTLTRYAREVSDSQYARKLKTTDWPHPFIIGSCRMGPMAAYLASRYEDLLRKITIDCYADWTKSPGPLIRQRPRLTGSVDWIDVAALYIFKLPIELLSRIRQCQRRYRDGRRCPNWFLAAPAHIDDHWTCSDTCRKALWSKIEREKNKKALEDSQKAVENGRGARAPRRRWPLTMSQKEYHHFRGYELGKQPPVKLRMRRNFGSVLHPETREAYSEDCPKGAQKLTIDPEIARIAQLPLREMKTRIEEIFQASRAT